MKFRNYIDFYAIWEFFSRTIAMRLEKKRSEFISLIFKINGMEQVEVHADNRQKVLNKDNNLI